MKAEMCFTSMKSRVWYRLKTGGRRRISRLGVILKVDDFRQDIRTFTLSLT